MMSVTINATRTATVGDKRFHLAMRSTVDRKQNTRRDLLFYDGLCIGELDIRDLAKWDVLATSDVSDCGPRWFMDQDNLWFNHNEAVNWLMSEWLRHKHDPEPEPAEDPAPVDKLAGQPERAFPSSAIDPAFGGMSMWDWYAGQALAVTVIVKPDSGVTVGMDVRIQAAASAAASIADAMMAEREKRRAGV